MITCKFDVHNGARWEECGKPAVELKITSPTGEGFDYELCPEHLDALFVEELVKQVRTLLATPNEVSSGVRKVVIREDSYAGRVEGVIK